MTIRALPGELGDFTDKVEAVGALLGGVIDVHKTDVMPQRHTLFPVFGMNRMKTILGSVLVSLVVQVHILFGSKRALASQANTTTSVIERDKLFFSHGCSLLYSNLLPTIWVNCFGL